jgi:hypothetical protein
MAIPGYDVREKAEKLIADAKAVVEKYKQEGIPVPTAPVKAQVIEAKGDAKMQAEERLKAELAALQSKDNAAAASAALDDAAAAAAVTKTANAGDSESGEAH